MKRFLFLFLCLVFLSLAGGHSFAAENNGASIQAKPGDVIDVTVTIDKTDNLAGVKLVINYDKDLLTFKEGNSTKNTRSLMCVINDKKPGRLIVVMAGAKGVSGRELPLVTLTFEIKKDLQVSRATRLEIMETQLMSDQLKEVKGVLSARPIDISP